MSNTTAWEISNSWSGSIRGNRSALRNSKPAPPSFCSSCTSLGACWRPDGHDQPFTHAFHHDYITILFSQSNVKEYNPSLAFIVQPRPGNSSYWTPPTDAAWRRLSLSRRRWSPFIFSLLELICFQTFSDSPCIGISSFTHLFSSFAALMHSGTMHFPHLIAFQGTRITASHSHSLQSNHLFWHPPHLSQNRLNLPR